MATEKLLLVKQYEFMMLNDDKCMWNCWYHHMMLNDIYWYMIYGTWLMFYIQLTLSNFQSLSWSPASKITPSVEWNQNFAKLGEAFQLWLFLWPSHSQVNMRDFFVMMKSSKALGGEKMPRPVEVRSHFRRVKCSGIADLRIDFGGHLCSKCQRSSKSISVSSHNLDPKEMTHVSQITGNFCVLEPYLKINKHLGLDGLVFSTSLNHSAFSILFGMITTNSISLFRLQD